MKLSAPVLSFHSLFFFFRVSSTLEKATGKKNLIDGSPETCWTSQQVFRKYFRDSDNKDSPSVPKGLPQFIQLGFTHPVLPNRLLITFQGGFVGTRCVVCTLTEEGGKKEWKTLTTVYPEDVNRRQIFDLIPSEADQLAGGISTLKLIFEDSSDFFGRITVYDLRLEGIPMNE